MRQDRSAAAARSRGRRVLGLDGAGWRIVARYAVLPVVALGLCAAPVLAGDAREEPTRPDGLGAVVAFAEAVNGRDAAGAAALLDPAAVYQGVLVCAPVACVGRDAIAPVLADEVEDRTELRLESRGARSGPGWAVVRGEARASSLAPFGRVAYELRASVGAGGIAELRFLLDREDGPTASVLAGLSRLQAVLDDHRAAGDDGPVVLSGR